MTAVTENGKVEFLSMVEIFNIFNRENVENVLDTLFKIG